MQAHDVFVSYAHSDDEVPSGCSAGWVSTFVGELRKILRRRIGAEGADIWIDHQLASNEQVNATLRDKAGNSRTMVLFLSNGYLASEWCRSELEEFLRLNAAHKNRESVFVVELDRVDRSKWPPRLRELTPVCLHELDAETKRPLLIGYPSPPTDSRSPYWSRLNALAHLISEHLSRLSEADGGNVAVSSAMARPKELLPARAASAASETPQRTVWIAAPPDELAEAWEALAAGLRQQGATVLPLGRSNYSNTDAAQFKRDVEADLSRAGLLIQLLAAQAGPIVGGSGEDSCALQATLARLVQITGSQAKLMQWRAPSIDLNVLPDTSHRRLLQGTISCGFEAFRKSVLDAYQNLLNPEPLRVAPRQAEGRPMQLCVTAGSPDEANCIEVCEIVKRLGHNALPASPTPTPGQSPSDYRGQFEELLRFVDGVILVRGVVAPTWVQSRYAQLSKLSAGRRPWGALLEAPGASGDPLLFGRAEFERLDCRAGIQSTPIRQFIEALQGDAVGA
eukprot:m.14817 g.14817  ORF g.14817 m.14817 type:complete len:509 (+) comp23595_c0_seq1:97-1623(+)